jgi:hypothetical protein
MPKVEIRGLPGQLDTFISSYNIPVMKTSVNSLDGHVYETFYVGILILVSRLRMHEYFRPLPIHRMAEYLVKPQEQLHLNVGAITSVMRVVEM